MNQSSPPLLSIIIPIFNGADVLDRLMASILGQQFNGYEVILVDDGSTDDTYEKCRFYCEKYPRVRVIHTENHGVSHARNTGLAAAEGEWIQFIDADDTLEPEMLDAFYNAVTEQDVELAVCGCSRIRLKTGESVYCGPREHRTLDRKEIREFLNRIAMEDRYWALDYVWNKWFRREIIVNHRLGFHEDISLGEDFVFNAEYYQYLTGMVLLNKPYYHYQVGEDGLVSRFQKEPWITGRKLYDAHKKLYQKLDLWDSNELWIRCQAGRIAFGSMRLINSANCPYRKKEKLLFLEQMIKSEQFGLLLTYLKNQHEIRFKIYEAVLKTGSVRLIYFLITAEKLMCQLTGRA
ncbi:MAG: glycosyltransferase [Lachnospiraceae bacterium]